MQTALKQTQSKLYTAMQQNQTEMMKQFQEILAGNTKPTSGHQKQATNPGNKAHSFCGGGYSYQEGSSLGDGFQTRTIRLEVSRFDGEDPKMWCYWAA